METIAAENPGLVNVLSPFRPDAHLDILKHRPVANLLPSGDRFPVLPIAFRKDRWMALSWRRAVPDAILDMSSRGGFALGR